MQILSEEMIKGISEETLHTLGRIGKGYKQGYISENDCYQTMLSEIYNGFWTFLRSKDVDIRINCENYDAFANEYASFIEGVPSPDRKPWLFKKNSAGELQEEDRKLVLKLMSQYSLSPEYFEPVPSEIAKPERSFVHGWHGSAAYGVPFRCKDDGGLPASEDPVGKTYTLVNDRGLKAVITVREDRRNGDVKGLDFDERVTNTAGGLIVRLAQFLGEGYIEGYTSKDRKGTPDIIVRLDDKGKVNWLAYYSSEDDEREYESFPLWQEYFRWSLYKAARDKMMFSALFKRYMDQNDAGKI
ncbi:MAG: hypothetical protein J5528_02845 [Firmicutes bacterium]|nr:hypothetical protein [Bacillota bacterium]